MRGLPTEASQALVKFCGVFMDDPDLEGNTWAASKLVVDNTKYAVKDLFIIDLAHEEEIPVFIRIGYIVQVYEQWVLCGKLILPEAFRKHYHGYQIEDKGQWLIIAPGEELDYHALDQYQLHDDTELVVLHHIPCKRFGIINLY